MMDSQFSEFTPDITPIMLAAHTNNYEIIKLLVQRKVTFLSSGLMSTPAEMFVCNPVVVVVVIRSPFPDHTRYDATVWSACPAQR